MKVGLESMVVEEVKPAEKPIDREKVSIIIFYSSQTS